MVFKKAKWIILELEVIACIKDPILLGWWGEADLEQGMEHWVAGHIVTVVLCIF